MFRYARQFAEAEEIVIAAPFWDLSFHAKLKIYLGQITISGLIDVDMISAEDLLSKAKI